MNYNEGEVLGFTVINARWRYQRATGEVIAYNQIRVRHPGISTPKSIRYGWENFPNLNLFGSGNMPACLSHRSIPHLLTKFNGELAQL